MVFTRIRGFLLARRPLKHWAGEDKQILGKDANDIPIFAEDDNDIGHFISAKREGAK